MDKALAVINELERDGVIRKYAIGGAIGAMFYVEAVATFDLDVFSFLKNTGLVFGKSAARFVCFKRHSFEV